MAKKIQDLEDYSKTVENIDEIDGKDMTLKPDFYIHTALLKAQQALSDDELKDGILKFRIFIEHIQSLLKAAGSFDEETFNKEIADFKSSEGYKSETNEFVKHAQIANKKIELLLGQIFSAGTMTGSLSDKK